MQFISNFDRFSAFAVFLMKHNEALLSEPYCGKVSTVFGLFVNFCKTENKMSLCPTSLEEFGPFLRDFNAITGNTVGVANSDKFGAARIEWINWTALKIFREFLEGKEPKEEDVALAPLNNLGTQSDLFQNLMAILEAPLRTNAGQKTDPTFDYDYDRLWNFVTAPTAMETLSSARARLVASKRPFYEICELKAHVNIITRTFFNAKTLGQFNEIPSAARVDRLFLAAQGMIDSPTVQCIKTKIHYLPLITNYTDTSLGNCSYLDTCHKLKNCRYVHYFTMFPHTQQNECRNEASLTELDYTIGECHNSVIKKVAPAQWINCDVRELPFSILGKFAAIISDPAWDIHMALPYGTCKDAELLSLPMRELQDEGIICLWVTGRSIEIGRKALALWGYTVSDEVIWIKTNQLNRTIVTGRTGHWLNHSKEHLLVGVKGNPLWLNQKIDVDFIVSGTRETLRKPDELYEIVERLVGKHARKLEIFGRDNNIRPGWVSTYRNHKFHYTHTNYSHWKSGDGDVDPRGGDAAEVCGAPEVDPGGSEDEPEGEPEIGPKGAIDC